MMMAVRHIIATAAAVLLSAAAIPAGIEEQVDLDAIESAVDAGRLTQARLMLARANLASLSGPRVDMVMGRYYLARGEDALALDRFNRLLALGPSSRAATGAGIVALRLHQFGRARGYFTAAVEQDPASWQAWNGLGIVADANRAWSDAEDAYRHALALRPADAAILNNKGYSLLLQRRFGDAAATLRQASLLEPNNGQIQTNYEIAMALGGDYPGAVGIAGDDNDAARRLNNAGYAAWLKGDLPAARALLARAIEANASYYRLAAANLETVERDSTR
ncbi:tetratricopeptide repeat protein [Rhizorhabdus argentea]|uniref:tetratricopeptide repeat protein n=1 Tax=Rhizorhabdus argentea TaxID=1387174 RepID=UPI0030EF51F5